MDFNIEGGRTQEKRSVGHFKFAGLGNIFISFKVPFCSYCSISFSSTGHSKVGIDSVLVWTMWNC